MAISKIVTQKRTEKFDNIEKFVLDNEQDFSFLPQNAPAGSEAYVADRSKNWRKSPSLGWVPCLNTESGGGGGGESSSDFFFIDFTMDDDETIHCNKTFDEIKAAEADGKRIVASIFGNTTFLYGSWWNNPDVDEPTKYEFFFEHVSIGLGFMEIVSFSKDGTIELSDRHRSFTGRRVSFHYNKNDNSIWSTVNYNEIEDIISEIQSLDPPEYAMFGYLSVITDEHYNGLDCFSTSISYKIIPPDGKQAIVFNFDANDETYIVTVYPDDSITIKNEKKFFIANFIDTFAPETEAPTFSCDKTFEEILAAFESDKQMLFFLDKNPIQNITPLYNTDDEIIKFNFLFSAAGVELSLILNNDNTITYEKHSAGLENKDITFHYNKDEGTITSSYLYEKVIKFIDYSSNYNGFGRLLIEGSAPIYECRSTSITLSQSSVDAERIIHFRFDLTSNEEIKSYIVSLYPDDQCNIIEIY